MNAKETASAARSARKSARNAYGRGWYRMGEDAQHNAIAYIVMTDAAAFCPTMTASDMRDVFRVACEQVDP